MVPLKFEPEGVSFSALTLSPAPTPTPSLILQYLFSYGTLFFAFKIGKPEKAYAF